MIPCLCAVWCSAVHGCNLSVFIIELYSLIPFRRSFLNKIHTNTHSHTWAARKTKPHTIDQDHGWPHAASKPWENFRPYWTNNEITKMWRVMFYLYSDFVVEPSRVIVCWLCCCCCCWCVYVWVFAFNFFHWIDLLMWFKVELRPHRDFLTHTTWHGMAWHYIDLERYVNPYLLHSFQNDSIEKRNNIHFECVKEIRARSHRETAEPWWIVNKNWEWDREREHTFSIVLSWLSENEENRA